MRNRDAADTRRRILAAATAEFASYGIAGARVDRIADQAQTSKAQIYAYIGDKLRLFDAVFEQRAAAVIEAAPFTTDLAEYAVRLHDVAEEQPALIRLMMWARLEGVESPLDMDQAREKEKAIAEAQAQGTLDAAVRPGDVLALVLHTALTWSAVGMFPAPPQAGDRDRHRAALRHVIGKALAPQSS